MLYLLCFQRLGLVSLVGSHSQLQHYNSTGTEQNATVWENIKYDLGGQILIQIVFRQGYCICRCIIYISQIPQPSSVKVQYVSRETRLHTYIICHIYIYSLNFIFSTFDFGETGDFDFCKTFDFWETSGLAGCVIGSTFSQREEGKLLNMEKI